MPSAHGRLCGDTSASAVPNPHDEGHAYPDAHGLVERAARDSRPAHRGDPGRGRQSGHRRVSRRSAARHSGARSAAPARSPTAAMHDVPAIQKMDFPICSPAVSRSPTPTLTSWNSVSRWRSADLRVESRRLAARRHARRALRAGGNRGPGFPPSRTALLRARAKDDRAVPLQRLFPGKAARHLEGHRATSFRGSHRMSRFAIRFPYLIIVICLMTDGDRRGRAWCGCRWICFRRSRFPWWWWRHFTPGCRRSRSRTTSPSGRSGSSRSPAASTTWSRVRCPASSLIKIYFQPGMNRRLRGQQHRQSRHGGNAPSAAGHAAAGRAEVRRLEPARLPHHAQGRGHERNATARHRPLQGAQPGRRCARRGTAAAVRRPIPPDHGLCGSR